MSALQAECRRFESVYLHQLKVVRLWHRFLSRISLSGDFFFARKQNSGMPLRCLTAGIGLCYHASHWKRRLPSCTAGKEMTWMQERFDHVNTMTHKHCNSNRDSSMEKTHADNTECLAPEFFTVDRERCVGCGRCVADCAFKALKSDADGRPVMGEASRCMRCQHCFAICPTGAVRILQLRT